MLAKSLSFLAGADAAGIVLGARVPIILTSRADSRDDAAGLLRGGGAGRQGAPRAAPRRDAGDAMADAILVLNAGSSSIKFRVVRRATATSSRSCCAARSKGSYTAPRFVAERCAGQRASARKRWADGASSATPARSRISPTSCASHGGGHELVGRRPPRRAWRPGVRRSRCGSTPSVLAALDAAASRSRRCTSRTTWRRSGIARGSASGAAAGRLLRHRVPSQPARGGAGVRAAARRSRERACAATASTACPTSTSPRVLPQLDPRAAAGRDGRRAPRQRRQHVRDRGRHAASPARWASPRSTGCRWARAAARSIPGVMLYLMDERGMDARAIEELIYKQSGLLGVSGISSDMRALLASDDAARAASPSTCSSTASGASSARSRRRSAGSTRSCSPPASASTRRRSASASAATPPGSGVELDAGGQRGRRAAHQHAGEPGLRLGDPDQRGTDDRAPHAARGCWRLTARRRTGT